MNSLIFHIVDVFAEEKYAGNQLAVFRNIGEISGDKMQKIANEMHFSETTFVLSDKKKKGGYDVRIFTPSSEVPFAGHPTLGTAYVIEKEILGGQVEKVLINLEVGQIPVTIERSTGKNETLWMKQIPPTFGRKLDPASVSSLLNLDVKDIDGRYPIQEVSTGLPFLIVPLKTLDATRRARVDRAREKEIGTQAGGILIFSVETYDKKNDLNVRVFVDLLGIPEDPATGSGNGCLAAYLSKYRFFGDDFVNVRVEQGCEIGRPSLLYLKAENKKGEILVSVGGKVIIVASGKFVNP